ncbi:gamma-glutamylcyclotransferase [Luteolibacter pohnpeiensis]|uniref:Gamma-glutamylcyclotransferase family protein n=1 Tax=Luteolibacter pohnpeiensis TaxID=454153 RepID=A0A934VVV6_9BACT|nr:gamma-glutamylcyclotransferase family protein [Luteolibacter pohnpeiensis]MBK1882620.1 gamma-glutamylcyclotransferase [Luteolibacter pohnpeiensis]
MAELVFVYGTLRKGGSNEFRMEGCRLIGSATVAGSIYRIDWYPGLLLHSGNGQVRGEVYEVGAASLKDLDAYEGDEYRRLKAKAQLQDGTLQEVWLWEWLGEVDPAAKITTGDWLDQSGVD